MKIFLLAAAVCIAALPVFAQGSGPATPHTDQAAKATTSTGEPTGPSTSQGSADHTGDGSSMPAGQSTGPGTHHTAKSVPKVEKDRAQDSGKTSPQ